MLDTKKEIEMESSRVKNEAYRRKARLMRDNKQEGEVWEDREKYKWFFGVTG